MLSSILILFLLAAGAAGLALYPKSTEKQNGVTAVVSAVMLCSCYAVMSVWLSDRLTGRVHMAAVTLCFFVPAALLWRGIWRRRGTQRFFFRAADVAGIAVVLAFACGVAFHVFGVSLQPQYGSSVGAEQYMAAMRLIQYGSSRGEISFSEGIEALFIGVLAPFFPKAASVQAYIAAEVFLRMLEAGVFYAVVLAVSDRKLVRFAAPVFGVCYFFGYPSISLLWSNCEYWNAGALLFLYAVYSLLAIANKRAAGAWDFLRLACCAVTAVCCGGQYSAYAAPALSLSATVLWAVRFPGGLPLRRLSADKEPAGRGAEGGADQKEGASRKKKIWGAAAALLACDLCAAVWFYREFFVSLCGVAAGFAKTEEIYRCMYGDLLFFVPALIFVIVQAVGGRRGGGGEAGESRVAVIGVTGVVMVAATVILYVRWYQFALDTYYYFLNYYILWALGWVLAAAALELAAGSGQLPVFFSYTGMVAAIGALTLSNYDYYIWHHNMGYNQQGTTRNFFSLYRQSMDGLLADYGEYRLPEGFLEAVRFAGESEEGKRSAVVTADEALQYWNDGLAGTASGGYRLDVNEFPDVVRQLSRDQVDVVVAAKTEDACAYYAEYYRYCRVLYENDDAAVYAVADGSWARNAAMEADYPAAKQELFSYVAEHYAGETVPLMADRSAYIDYIMYENLTGICSAEFYTWNFMPVDNLNNLNAHGVTTIVLLNEDEYYQFTRVYMDRQVVVFENEAGRVIACDGTQWTTQY